jgi:hypothetical protein
MAQRLVILAIAVVIVGLGNSKVGAQLGRLNPRNVRDEVTKRAEETRKRAQEEWNKLSPEEQKEALAEIQKLLERQFREFQRRQNPKPEPPKPEPPKPKPKPPKPKPPKQTAEFPPAKPAPEFQRKNLASQAEQLEEAKRLARAARAEILEKAREDIQEGAAFFQKVLQTVQDSASEVRTVDTRPRPQGIAEVWVDWRDSLRQGWRYLFGINKTIYEKQIELTSDNKEHVILDVRKHQRVGITIHPVDGNGCSVVIRDAKEKKDAVKGQIGNEVRVRVNHPEIMLELVSGDRAVVHVACTERRGTFLNLFAAGSTIDPDSYPENRPAAPKSNVSNREVQEWLRITKEKYSGGYYFFMSLSYLEVKDGSWVGPYQSRTKAVEDMEKYRRRFGGFSSSIDPQYFTRQPVRLPKEDEVTYE